MTSQLTRVIMKNIVEKCRDYKKEEIGRIHLNNREIDMIREVINKKSRENEKMEADEKRKDRDSSNYITLDELINNRVVMDKAEDISRNEQARESHGAKIKKINLEDVVPKVSLASIGKKDRVMLR